MYLYSINEVVEYETINNKVTDIPYTVIMIGTEYNYCLSGLESLLYQLNYQLPSGDFDIIDRIMDNDEMNGVSIKLYLQKDDLGYNKSIISGVNTGRNMYEGKMKSTENNLRESIVDESSLYAELVEKEITPSIFTKDYL